MLKKRLFRKIVFGPFRKVAGTLANIIVFDIAMSLHHHLKRRFSQSKPEKDDEEDVILIRPKFKNKGGGDLF